jgi:thymidylate synthase ThyX
VNAKIICDSINPLGQRITTFILPRFPKCLLAELNTHRTFSRNAASSRAIPLEKMIESIRADPYLPDWTQKAKGMGGKPISDPVTRKTLEAMSLAHLDETISVVREMHRLGAAKENVNRFLEPWMRVPVIVTATEWDNFFKLRTHEATQADFRQTAIEMCLRLKEHAPERLGWNQWHIPLVTEPDLYNRLTPLLKVATARCARVSYLNHVGAQDESEDIALHDRLLASGHFSPFEHSAQATPGQHANFNGWRSYRQEVAA